MFEFIDPLKFMSSIFIAILPVINPIGTSLVVMSMTAALPEEDRIKFVIKLGTYCICILGVFFLAGKYVLLLFGVSIPIVQISGGLVVAAMGWQMLNQKNESPKLAPAQERLPVPSEDINRKIFYPITFPLTMGPGTLSVAMTFSAHSADLSLVNESLHDVFGMIGLILAVIVYCLCVFYMPKISRHMKASYLEAISKIVAFFVLCIGAQILWSGIKKLLDIA